MTRRARLPAIRRLLVQVGIHGRALPRRPYSNLERRVTRVNRISSRRKALHSLWSTRGSLTASVVILPRFRMERGREQDRRNCSFVNSTTRRAP